MNEHNCRYEEGKYCSIHDRLVHLRKSKFIRRFDDICSVTGQYSLDISEADAIIDDYHKLRTERLNLLGKLDECDVRCRDAEARAQSATDKAENLEKQLKEAKEHILELEKKNEELSGTINRMHGGCERAIELRRLLDELFVIGRDQVVSDDEIRKMMKNLRDECTKLTKENIQLYDERIQLKNEKKQQADDILELRTELEQLHTQRRITEMIYKSDAEAVVKDTDAKIQSANDRAANAKKEAKAAKERADNGWERVRYLERKLKDTESLNEQLLRELARRENASHEIQDHDADVYQLDVLKYAPSEAVICDLDADITVRKLYEQQLTYGVIGLCGEAGEASEIVKKYAFQGHTLDTYHLAIELGDVLWYVAYTAHNIGYPLGKIMAINQEKLAKRYPDGKFDPEKSRNRKAGDI